MYYNNFVKSLNALNKYLEIRPVDGQKGRAFIIDITNIYNYFTFKGAEDNLILINIKLFLENELISYLYYNKDNLLDTLDRIWAYYLTISGVNYDLTDLLSKLKKLAAALTNDELARVFNKAYKDLQAAGVVD